MKVYLVEYRISYEVEIDAENEEEAKLKILNQDFAGEKIEEKGVDILEVRETYEYSKEGWELKIKL